MTRSIQQAVFAHGECHAHCPPPRTGGGAGPRAPEPVPARPRRPTATHLSLNPKTRSRPRSPPAHIVRDTLSAPAHPGTRPAAPGPRPARFPPAPPGCLPEDARPGPRPPPLGVGPRRDLLHGQRRSLPTHALTPFPARLLPRDSPSSAAPARAG